MQLRNMARPAVEITWWTATLSTIFAIFSCLPWAIMGFLGKQMLRLIVWLVYGPEADVVAGCDCATMLKPMRTPDGLLHMLLDIDGRVKLDEIRRRFVKNALNVTNPDGTWKHPKLRSTFRWFFGFRIMVVEQRGLKLDRHFGYLRDKVGDPVVCRSDEDVEDAVEGFANYDIFPESSGLPPWKFRVFYKMCDRTNKVSTLVAIHIDHVILDGGAFALTLMPALLDFEASSDPTELFRNLKPVSNVRRWVLHVKGFLLAPLTLARVLHPDYRVPDNNPLHRRKLEGAMKGRYYLAPRTVPVSHLLTIREKTRAKINTIIASCVYRALNRFAEEVVVLKSVGNGAVNGYIKCHDEKPLWKWTLFTPLSTWIPGDKLELTNKAAALPYMVTNWEIGCEDPLLALVKVQEAFEEPSKMEYAWSWRTFNTAFMNVGPVDVYDAMVPLLMPLNSVTGAFSNIRGPDVRQKCFGFDLSGISAYVSTWESADLGIFTCSYNGDLSISLAGNKSSFKNRGELRELSTFIVQEIQSLHRAVTKKRM